jgi:DnaJ-domain-containing protein 1
VRTQGSAPEPLHRGELVRLLYRLGRAHATGVLTIQPARARAEVLVLRRGQLITAETDIGGRVAGARLARLAAEPEASWTFDGGTAAYPPGATGRQLPLTRWVRAHLEGQLDAARADRLLAELAGVRLVLRADHAPEALDDTDRRLIDAMAQPRRLDQIWPMARTPRYRLLAFVHFLAGVGALTRVGVAAEDSAPNAAPSAPPTPVVGERTGALRLLGVADEPSPQNVKRAYRRLARALHPDLHPGASSERRRELEARLREVNAAYARLS